MKTEREVLILYKYGAWCRHSIYKTILTCTEM